MGKMDYRGLGGELILCILYFASCILVIGCGERENKNLVAARSLIQQGKYKEAPAYAGVKNELNIALKAESENPEALCPLKALEIIAEAKAAVSISARQEAAAKIISLVRPLEDEIVKLESMDKDLMTDDDKDRLKKLSRKWTLSLEPAAMILTAKASETGWIGDLGQPAIDLLIESLKVSNPAIQNDVVELLVSLTPDRKFRGLSFEALVSSLQNKNSAVRRRSVIALGKIGDERAIEPITSLLDDEDPGVRFYVPVALDMILRSLEQRAESREQRAGNSLYALRSTLLAIGSLHKALKNEMAQVRIASADIMSKIEDVTGIDLLVELLADDNSYVKASATNALIKIGAPVVPKLIAVVENAASGVSLPPTDFTGDKIGNRYKKELTKRAALQVSAASIMGSINDPRAIDPLLEALKREAGAEATEDEKANLASVRAGAAAALTAIGPVAVESLIKLLTSPTQNESARADAATILGNIGDKRAVMPLIDALKDQAKAPKSIRANAAASLGVLKDRRATMPLIEALKDTDVVTRSNAAASLGTMADKRATQYLIDVVMDGTEREKNRDAALSSLGTIKDTTALETLVTVLINEYEKDGIRKTAAAALRTIENAWASEPLVALLKGEVVYGIFMPGEGVISKWLKKAGDRDLIKDLTDLMEISPTSGTAQAGIKAPASGTLIKIYVQDGQPLIETVRGKALVGLISFEDKEIKQEERSSIRSVAASALGKVKGEGALPALMYSLRKDKSAAVRKNAASSLREIEKADARSVLIKALNSDDSGIVRSEAAYALGKIKGDAAVPPLIDALRKDKYESTRVQAAWSLGEIKDKRSIDPLVDVIVKGRKGQPEASAVVDEAITALDKIAEPAVKPLVEVLENNDIDEIPRSRAARILGLIEDVSDTKPLIAALKDKSVVVRSEAAKSLGLITDRQAVEALITVLEDENEWVTVRANAITSLGNIKDERVVMPLIDALSSEIPAIRSNAVTALGLIEDKRATMPLVRILEDEKEDDTIRANVISSLGSIGDARAVGALVTSLRTQGDNATIRQNAASALGALGANVAVRPLMAIVSNINEPIALRSSAAEALGKINDKSASSLMRDRLGDDNEFDTVWNSVAEAAGKLRVAQLPARVSERAQDTWEPAAVRLAAAMALAGAISEENLSLLLEMLNNATKEIRCAAALALGAAGRKEAVQPLMEKLEKDGEEIVRRDSAKALADLADPASEQALIKALKDDAKDSVKIEAVIALGNIKGKDGIAALASVLQDTAKARALRWNAAKALGATGSQEAVPALKAALEDNIGNIHFEAAKAIRSITGENYGYER